MSDKILPRDWRFMLESAYRISSTGSIWELECESLRCLQQLIPCDQGTFFVYDGVDERGIPHLTNSTAVVGDEAQYLDEFMSCDYDSDSYFRGMALLRHNVVYRDSDILPEKDRINSRLFKDIYEKQGIFWGLRAYLAYDGILMGNISIFNSKSAGDFTNLDISILRLMEPHITLRMHQLRMCEDSKSVSGRNTQAASPSSKYNLTNRETEILQLLLSGMEDPAIVDRLCISPSTLKKHVYNIYKKTGVSNRIQLYNLMR